MYCNRRLTEEDLKREWKDKTNLGEECRCFVSECNDEMPPDVKLDDRDALLAHDVRALKHLHQKTHAF